ncbi:MAG: glycosyltransferase [Acidobacteriota bacterium]
MKIFRIIARLNVGGPARHVVWLTERLQNDEFESRLIAGTVPSGEEDMSYFARQHNVEPIFISELSRELSAKDVISLWKIYREMLSFQPDVVHTHTAKAGTIGRMAAFVYKWLTWRTLIARPRRVAVVHTFHGHVFHSYYGNAKTSVFLMIERILARFATDRIITISNQQFHEIHERFRVGRKEQFSIIRLGIELPDADQIVKSRYLLRNEIGAADGETVVGFVGRLTAIKDLPTLLEAAEMVVNDGSAPPVRFVIIGDGELRGELEQIAAARGLSTIVHFLGNRENIADLLPGMDMIALTSANEGTPLSLIEAMSFGVPFVSTAVGGVVDLAGDIKDSRAGFDICERGITTEPGSASSLSKGLIYLAKDEKLQCVLSSNGKQFVREHYSVERLVGDVEELYRELVFETEGLSGPSAAETSGRA